MESSIAQSRTESRNSRFTGKHVHFIGVGGSGMAGLARMLLDNGAIVSGSEPNPNPQTFELAKRGAKISRDQIGELLSRDIDLVVRTAAIKDNNAEFQAARALKIETIKYAQMLGLVMAERFGIAVAGTHGKSTTTAMISHALLQAGLDPSFVIGGTVPQLGNVGSHSGAGKAFVAEACEFDRSFHNLRPRVAIITNIEEDHLDCYKNIDEIVESFQAFAKLIPSDGLIITSATDANIKMSLARITAKIEYCALSDKPTATWTTIPGPIKNGCHCGQIFHNGKSVGTFELSVPGAHNLLNATMALAACHAAGADLTQCIDALNHFTGVDRRMSRIGSLNGATVVDDYGHHPTEIRATLKAARERFSPTRLFCVFQPHQHSRTRFLLKDFAAAFSDADETIVPDIYFVRDSDAERQLVSAADLVERITRNGQSARHIPSFPDIVSHLRAQAREGDLIITMGAGNVWEIARDLVS